MAAQTLSVSTLSPQSRRSPPLPLEQRPPKDVRLISSIAGNTADGHAIQQNGDSIEHQTIKVYNHNYHINIETMNVQTRATSLQSLGCAFVMDGGNMMGSASPRPTTSSSSSSTPIPRPSLSLSANTNSKYHLSINGAARPGSTPPHQSGDSRTDLKLATRPAIDLKGSSANPFMLIYANHKAPKHMTAGRVSIDRRVQGNWMRRGILRREGWTQLQLQQQGGCASEQTDNIVRHITYNGKAYQGRGDFVDFACRNGRPYLYRFYILEHADFDFLLGSPK